MNASSRKSLWFESWPKSVPEKTTPGKPGETKSIPGIPKPTTPKPQSGPNSDNPNKPKPTTPKR